LNAFPKSSNSCDELPALLLRTLRRCTVSKQKFSGVRKIWSYVSSTKQESSRSAHGGRFDRLKRRGGANKKEQEDAFDAYHKVVCHFGCPVGWNSGICGKADTSRYSWYLPRADSRVLSPIPFQCRISERDQRCASEGERGQQNLAWRHDSGPIFILTQHHQRTAMGLTSAAVRISPAAVRRLKLELRALPTQACREPSRPNAPPRRIGTELTRDVHAPLGGANWHVGKLRILPE
jgi:hypothetical protein